MAEKQVSKKRNNLALYGGVVACGLVLTIGAILYGQSDTGQIDVSATIANSNKERGERGEEVVAQIVPSAKSDIPNGGLVGTGKSEPPKSEVEGSATSTNEKVSSIEDDESEVPEDKDEEGETDEVIDTAGE